MKLYEVNSLSGSLLYEVNSLLGSLLLVKKSNYENNKKVVKMSSVVGKKLFLIIFHVTIESTVFLVFSLFLCDSD